MKLCEMNKKERRRCIDEAWEKYAGARPPRGAWSRFRRFCYRWRILIFALVVLAILAAGALWAGPPDTWVTASHEGANVSITWRPVYSDVETLIYLGQNLIRCAPAGESRFRFRLDRFGVAIFSVGQKRKSEPGYYRASTILDMGRITYDPVQGADGYVIYISPSSQLSDATRHEVGVLTEMPLVDFGLAPAQYWVWVASERGGYESPPAGPVSFRWENALIAPRGGRGG